MFTEPKIWLHFINDKAPEAWFSILGGVMYVWYKSGAKTKTGKATEAVISGSLAIAIGPDIIEATGYPDSLVYLIVAVFGFFIMEVLLSIASDKEEIKKIVLKKLYKLLNIDSEGNKK